MTGASIQRRIYRILRGFALTPAGRAHPPRGPIVVPVGGHAYRSLSALARWPPGLAGRSGKLVSRYADQARESRRSSSGREGGITRESAEGLNLQTGKPVTVIIKSTDVMLATD